MVIGFMFAVQTAFASPTGDKMNLETLNKSDAQVLFQDDMMNQQIVLLDESQMNELKAKGWWSRLRHSVSNEVRRWGRDLRHTPREIQRVLGQFNNLIGVKIKDPGNTPVNQRGGATTPIYDSRGRNYTPIYRGYRSARHYYYHR